MTRIASVYKKQFQIARAVRNNSSSYPIKILVILRNDYKKMLNKKKLDHRKVLWKKCEFTATNKPKSPLFWMMAAMVYYKTNGKMGVLSKACLGWNIFLPCIIIIHLLTLWFGLPWWTSLAILIQNGRQSPPWKSEFW